MEKMIEFVADGLVFDVLHGLLKESNFSEQIQIERFYMQTTLEISEKIRITIVCQKKYVTDLFIKMDALISNNGGIWDTYSIITYDRITSAKK